MKEWMKEIQNANVGIVKINEELASHTTMKVGGPADILVEPDSLQSLKKVMEIVRKHNTPWTAIGRGSNLLVHDGGIEGVVIKLGKGIDHLEENGDKMVVGAGYSLIVLATQLSRKGLKGLEFAAGIPGSLGGAVYMNAGAHGSDMSQIVTKVHILFEDGTMEWLTNDEMKFAYRTSVLQQERPGIVLEAELLLEPGDKTEITDQLKKNKDYRRDTQPWNHPCAGSIFRNPLPKYAGQLVESSGLKGHQVGGARISDMHGNFIVNAGGAKAQDVLNLIQHIKGKIKEEHDVEMHTEVEIIGRESKE
ncbi:UDP-N-acetylmuramate dehydrogenase [Mangrovibacillus cuniculi]|uniref:UDP-N-acetylenolpyruvoylglucosamine reductase n=2 Tax=Mangrovibacillus cuniculi TaxID=2593652 RepID=A0A7S8CAK2_9BACI|nr:UDP-N-acetylmuramate dehydrogenase [Mangrovibacillus cuniculi]QPC46258.1 UDP-N-acetylmuramate dehydrogenase [Mangrovibacillus cuniculi]